MSKGLIEVTDGEKISSVPTVTKRGRRNSAIKAKNSMLPVYLPSH